MAADASHLPPENSLFDDDDDDDQVAGGGGPGGGAGGGSGMDSSEGGRRRLFSKELRCLLYGYGDDQNPYTETVDILEDLVMEFITEMTKRAMEIGRSGRVQVYRVKCLDGREAYKVVGWPGKECFYLQCR